MRVLLVGTVPPPGGSAARSFAREAARRSALGDSVEVLSSNPLSSAHRIANLRGRQLARELRACAGEFDLVELRVDETLVADARSMTGLSSALSRFAAVTLFVDSPVPFRAGSSGARLSSLWSSASSIIVANEEDRAGLAALGVPSSIIEVLPRIINTIPTSVNWPDASDPSLQEAVVGAVKRRARADREALSTKSAMSTLVSATARVRPSVKGSTVWLIRRVIGKTRGAVTKVLRPTPKHPKPTT